MGAALPTAAPAVRWLRLPRAHGPTPKPARVQSISAVLADVHRDETRRPFRHIELRPARWGFTGYPSSERSPPTTSSSAAATRAGPFPGAARDAAATAPTSAAVGSSAGGRRVRGAALALGLTTLRRRTRRARLEAVRDSRNTNGARSGRQWRRPRPGPRHAPCLPRPRRERRAPARGGEDTDRCGRPRRLALRARSRRHGLVRGHRHRGRTARSR